MHHRLLAALTAGALTTAALVALAVPAGAGSTSSPATSTAPAKAPAPTKGSSAAKVAASAPTPATPALKVAPAARTVVVAAGDSWYGLAGRLGVTAPALARANGRTTESVLQPGQRLRVPDAAPLFGMAGAATDIRSTPSKRALVRLFRAAADEAGVPLDLLMATAYRESAWNPAAVSPTGAVGLGQLLPGTARWIAVQLMGEPALDRTKPADNLRMTAHLLRFLLDRHQDPRIALAAYFEGTGTVTRSGVSPLADRYARSILAGRQHFQGF